MVFKLVARFLTLIFTLSCLPLTTFAQALDVEPPEIQHELVEMGVAGEDQLVEAIVTDNVEVASVTLFYRFGDSGDYESRAMELEGGDNYTATLATSSGENTVLNYYIEAVDKAGSATNRGFTFNPLKRDIKSPLASDSGSSSEPPAAKKSNTLWYVLGGVLVAGLIAGAAGGGGGGGGGSEGCGDDGSCTVTLQLGQPQQ